jgi:hypothetical protein
MSPLDLALAALLAFSFLAATALLALIALILEAVMFAIGYRGGPNS